MGYRCQTLSDVVDLAARFEDDYKQNLEGEPKGKGKMLTPHSFSSGTPSSTSTESSGWKRKAGPASHGRRSFAKGGSAGFNQSRSSGSSWGEKTCFGCGQPGHIRAQCPHQVQSQNTGVCYNCGKAGHLQKDCPEPSKKAGDAPRQPTKGRMFTISALDAGPSEDVVEGKEQ